MKAALLTTPGQPLEIVDDITIASPGHGQVKVRVCHCGLCHSDLSIADGAFPSLTPVVLGHEAAGVVEEVGPGVSGLAEGDHVVLTVCPPCGSCYWCVRGEQSLCVNALGIQTCSFPDGSTGLQRGSEVIYRGVNLAAFAEYVLVQESGAVKIADDIPLDIACVIGCAVQTGVGAVLNTAGVEEGATVLVAGLGGIGLSAVQGARIAGAARIMVSDPVAERRAMAERFGATDLIDPTTEDLFNRVVEITEVGVDYAFETAGRAALAEQVLGLVRNGGTVVCVGAAPIDESINIGPEAVFTISGKKILGCVLGSCNALRDIPRLVSLWQNGSLNLEDMITAHRPLAEINEAMDDLRASRGVRTVLDIWNQPTEKT
ncbi:MAG: Zn-dependent alcohol dehydrogenase [Deltaproteobacteria bacterium]